MNTTSIAYKYIDANWSSNIKKFFRRGSPKDDNQQKPLISVIMPVYNLSRIVTYSIKAVEELMRASGYKYEIIVVDDGSKDDTYTHILMSQRTHTIRVFRLPNNMGKGVALIYGFKKSRGDIVVFYDGDLDIDPRQITLLVSALRITNSDIVITSKWHPQSKLIATPLRRFLSKSFYALVRLLLGLRVSDTQTGAKAFRKTALGEITRYLTTRRYAFDVELLTAATMLGFRIIEVPAPWGIKLTSRFKTGEIIKMFLDITAITYRFRVKNPISNATGR